MKIRRCLPIIWTLLVLAIVTIVGLATMTASGKPAGKTIILKYADQNAANGWEAIEAAQPWLEQVEEATQGKVQFQTYFAESLVRGADSWDATRQDLADIAWMFHGYWADQTPLANVISLPFLPFTSAQQASGIFWQLYQKYPTLRAEFQDNHVLMTWASTPYFLVTAEKQVKTLEDIQGLKIRVPTGPPVDIMQSLGADTVTIGMPRIYLYLQQGVLDGMATAWESVISFRQYELVRNYTYIPLFTVYFTMAINNSVWDSLSPDIQSEISSVSGLNGSLFWGKNMFDTAALAGREQIRQEGRPVYEYTIPESELVQWTAQVKPWDDWVSRMTQAGHPEAREILNTTLELIQTYHPEE